VPVHYHAQVMHGLGVKRRTCIVCAMAGLDTMVFYRVDRDDEAIAGMRDVAVSFWRDHVDRRCRRQPISMGDVNRLFKRHNGRPVELDDEHAQALLDLRAVRSKLAAFEGDEAELELKVAKYVCAQWGLDAPEEGTSTTPRSCTTASSCAKWAAGRGAHLDQQRLAAEQPDVKSEIHRPRTTTAPSASRSNPIPRGVPP
jgi:predicted phage-related endonuclease